MSSDQLFAFDEPFYQHPTTPSPMDDPFSDSTIDTILQELANQQTPCSSNFTQIPQTHFPNFPNSPDFPTGYLNFSATAIKTEDPLLPSDSQSYLFGSQSYDDSAMMRLHERGYSNGSHSYEGDKPWFAFQPRFDPLFDSSAFLCSPENVFSGGQIRRACSTGDLHKVKNNQNIAHGESDATTLMEESNFKVGRYNAEERKERIDRYRAKRNQRNFNKTIKYACRKTLADSRPRVRGRFARNDEPGEVPKLAPCSNRYEDDDDILLYGWHEEEDVGIVSGVGSENGGCGEERRQFLNSQFGASSELHHYLGF